MINSKSIKDLHPVVADICKKHIQACADKGVKIIITSTLRDNAYQASLYAQGRSKPGNIVTNMKTIGAHGYGLAYDIVPVVDGIAIWDTSNKAWKIAIEEGRKLKLTCGADWKSFPDAPHFEFTEGLTKADLEKGKRPSFWKKTSTVKNIAKKAILKVKSKVIKKKKEIV